MTWLIQKINGEGKTPHQEEEGGDHPNDNSKGRGLSPPRVKVGNDMSNLGGFVSKEELFGLLRDQQPEGTMVGTAFQPPYPHDI